MSYPDKKSGQALGRSLCYGLAQEKSVPMAIGIIVVGSNEPCETQGGLTTNEGPNVKLIEMLQGGLNFEFTSLALNVDQSCDRCKERLQYA